MLIVCFLTGLILAVRSSRGTMHDFKILKKSKLNINKDARIKGDLGFYGIQKLYPNAELPYKSSKHHPLSKEQKQYNRQLAKERIVVKHINRNARYSEFAKNNIAGNIKTVRKLGNWFQLENFE